MTAGMLAMTVFCQVSGGPFGLESAVKEAGPGMALLLIALLPIFWALPDALTTAELAPALPMEGGYVMWVKRAMGPFWGFLNAWWTWIYALVDAAIYPVLFTTYLATLLKSSLGITLLDTQPVARWGVAMVMIAAFTFLNVRGTRLVGKTSVVMAWLIIAPFLLLSVVGLGRWFANPTAIITSFTPAETSVGGALSAGLSIVMWNYLGWDALSTIAEEVEEPQKSYPKAIFIGVPLVTAVYLLPTLAGLAHYKNIDGWEEGAWPAIAQASAGTWLASLMHVAALVSPIALFTGSLLGSSRVPLVLAEDGFLPKKMAEIHPRFGTPWVSILVCGGVYAALATKSFKDLVELNVVMYGAALFLESATLLILRKKEPNLHRPFKIPGGWPVLWAIFLAPVAMVILLFVLSIQEEGWEAQKLTLAAIVSGPLVYGGIQLFRKKSASA